MRKVHEVKNSKKFNATINKVHEEMSFAEKLLLSRNVSRDNKYLEVYCYDLQFLNDDEILSLENKYGRIYDLTMAKDMTPRKGAALKRITLSDENDEDYICEFIRIDWLVTNNKLGRIFNFGNLGDVAYSQVKKNRKDEDESYDYFAKYDVNNNSLALRIVRLNEDIIVEYSGDRKVIQSDGVLIVEDSKGLEISTVNGSTSFLVSMDSNGRIDSKILISGVDTFVFCGNELVSATRKDNEEEFSLEITPELIDKVNTELLELQIGTLNKYELLTFVSGVKSRLFNAIKSIKNDVPLAGLSKRLDILLSMLYTKNKPIIVENGNKKLKKCK